MFTYNSHTNNTIEAPAITIHSETKCTMQNLFLISTKCMFFIDIMSNIILLIRPEIRDFPPLQNIQTRSGEELYTVKEDRNILQSRRNDG